MTDIDSSGLTSKLAWYKIITKNTFYIWLQAGGQYLPYLAHVSLSMEEFFSENMYVYAPYALSNLAK